MPDLQLEHTLLDYTCCGIDEVGRGPLAGPVVAGCVIIPADTQSLPFWTDVQDSKMVKAARRTALAHDIMTHTYWGLGIASVAEIDQVNILQATFLAMRRAFDQMTDRHGDALGRIPPLYALIDGNRTPPGFPAPVQTVIKGDQKSLSIAAASIIAKVARDQMMADLHTEYPMYGWIKNAGYGTAAHMNGLALHGPCPHHRQSFAPVKAVLGLYN